MPKRVPKAWISRIYLITFHNMHMLEKRAEQTSRLQDAGAQCLRIWAYRQANLTNQNHPFVL